MPGPNETMDESNDVIYSVTYWGGHCVDTVDVEEARQAIREGRDVMKSVRKVFYSGPSLIRLYVSTPIKTVRDL